jgi:hypothetical protein
VQQLGHVGVVVYVHDDALPLFEAQQRPGKGAVVERRGDDLVG